jgi:ABC-type hemin transport system substrate-binding protein
MRVVSLVPSVTETLLAWGVDVVACTRFCEQPQLPHVGGTKDPDIAAILALAPDVVVVDREENRREDAEAMVAAGLRLHVTHVVDLDGVPPMLADLAAAVGVDPPTIMEAGAWPAEVPGWASGAVLIWRRPWMALGAATYGSSLLGRLGVTNVVTAADGTYPAIELDELGRRSPDLVLLPSEPYPFGPRHVDEVAAALPTARVALVDGQDLLWWGVRTPGALTRLAAAIGTPT